MAFLKADNKNLIIEGINATGSGIFFLSGPDENDSGVVYIIYKWDDIDLTTYGMSLI